MENQDAVLKNAWLPKPIFRILSGQFLNNIDLLPCLILYTYFKGELDIQVAFILAIPMFAIQGFLATKGLSIGRLISARVLINRDSLQAANVFISLIRPPLVFTWSMAFFGYFVIRAVLKGVGPQISHDMTPYENSLSELLGEQRMHAQQRVNTEIEKNHVRKVFSNADWLFYYDSLLNTTIVSIRYRDISKLFIKNNSIGKSDSDLPSEKNNQAA